MEILMNAGIQPSPNAIPAGSLRPEERSLRKSGKDCRQWPGPLSPSRECGWIWRPATPIQFSEGPWGFMVKSKARPPFAVIIGDTSQPGFQEAAGYTGEGLILEATSMDLATCWVGGFFNPYAAARQFPLQPRERILAVSPLGYAEESKTFEEKILSGFGRNSKRIPLTQFVSGLELSRYPQWLPEALEAVRFAPSAMNRQPWRLYIGVKFNLVFNLRRSFRL